MELEKKRYSSNPQMIYKDLQSLKKLDPRWTHTLLLFFKLWGIGSPKAEV